MPHHPIRAQRAGISRELILTSHNKNTDNSLWHRQRTRPLKRGISRVGALLSAAILSLTAGMWLLATPLLLPYLSSIVPSSHEAFYYIGSAALLTVVGAVITYRVLRRRDERHEELQREALLLDNLMRLHSDICWRADADGGNVTLLHDRYEGSDYQPVADSSRFLMICDADVKKVAEAWQRAIASRQPLSVALRLGLRGGDYRWFHCEAYPVLGADGQVREWIGTCRDNSELMKRESQRQRDSATLKLATDAAGMITSCWDLKENRLTVSGGWHERLGMPRSDDLRDAIGQLRHRIHPEDRGRIMKLVTSARSEPRDYEEDIRLRHSSGRYRWFHTRGTVLRDVDGEPTHILGIYWDITERMNHELEMRRLAYTDELTQLPNRRAMLQDLEKAVERARTDSSALGVMCLDIDDFGAVNDAHGHAGGDRLMAEFAARLREAVGPGDTLYRLDGDQYALVFAGKADQSLILAAARNIHDALKEPLGVGQLSIYVNVTSGLSLYPDHTLSPQTLFEYADAAMNKGKSQRRGQVNLFRHRIVLEPSRWLDIKNALQSALSEGELYLLYQPMYHLRRDAVTGMEALLRWDSPALGAVSPEDFVPIAEDAGLIADVDRFVLREVASQIKRWRLSGRETVPVSVNLSARSLEQDGCATVIRNILAEYGLASDAVVLELTETAILHNESLIREHLAELRSHGFAIAIDDFGTGNCGLQKLPMYGAKRLKIDKSFVRGMLNNSYDAAIVKSVIHLARGLDLEVVAEGVETHEEQLFLQSLDCDVIQGYYYAKPLRAEIVRRYLVGEAGAEKTIG